MINLPTQAELCEGLPSGNGDFILLLSDGQKHITMLVPANFHRLSESLKIEHYLKPALAQMAFE